MSHQPSGPPSSRIRSPRFDNVVGKILSNRRIQYYRLKGFYGEAQRLSAEAEERSKPKRAPAVDLFPSICKLLDI